jgi:hypothetical protein
MPNECMNTLSVMGEKENVEEFVKFVTTGIDKISLFNSLIPFPEELDDTTSPVNLADKGKNKELIEKYGSDNWYDWRVDNWGTKLGDYELTTSEIAKAYNEEQWYINFNYTTAWSPGENELANAICKHFPKLKAMIQYEEPGMCFAGETLVLNGRIVRQDTWELNQLNEHITEVYWPQYEQESE